MKKNNTIKEQQRNYLNNLMDKITDFVNKNNYNFMHNITNDNRLNIIKNILNSIEVIEEDKDSYNGYDKDLNKIFIKDHKSGDIRITDFTTSSTVRYRVVINFKNNEFDEKLCIIPKISKPSVHNNSVKSDDEVNLDMMLKHKSVLNKLMHLININIVNNCRTFHGIIESSERQYIVSNCINDIHFIKKKNGKYIGYDINGNCIFTKHEDIITITSHFNKDNEYRLIIDTTDKLINESSTENLANNVKVVRTSDGITRKYKNDILFKVEYYNGNFIEYNSDGKIITERKDGVTKKFFYDDKNRISIITMHDSTTLVKYTYNEDCSFKTETYKDNKLESVSYFDSDSKLIKEINADKIIYNVNGYKLTLDDIIFGK